MLSILTLSLLFVSAAASTDAYVAGAPTAWSACTSNAAPLSISHSVFHGMADDPQAHIPNRCLFPWPGGQKLNGSFHFGFSEMEYDEHWFVDGQGRLLTTRAAGGWGGADGAEWVVDYTAGKGTLTLDGYRVLNGQELVGYLVYVEVANQRHLGLIDLAAKSGAMVEAGFFTPYEKPLPGKMPQASRVLLHADYLKRFSANDLKIMRNEIFARHGHRFKPGGAMEKHFRAQSWYQKLPAPKKAIQSLLSALEKENIRRIQRAEKR